MAGVFWYDGAWMDQEPKILGPMDHAFWLGSVVFDGARSFGGVAPDLDLHCARAVRSAVSMGMRPKLAPSRIEELCREGLARMGAAAAKPAFQRAAQRSPAQSDAAGNWRLEPDRPVPGERAHDQDSGHRQGSGSGGKPTTSQHVGQGSGLCHHRYTERL
jgi:hypothetical protein